MFERGKGESDPSYNRGVRPFQQGLTVSNKVPERKRGGLSP
jgi:hypothetical protein